jgi:serine protease Do
VVRDASEVVVKLTDRREFRAKVLGSDPQSDVAVLKIDAKNLPVVPLAKSMT